MCQLLGMNSRQPASLQFAMQGFLRRGGETDHHSDGWGVAHFEGDRCCLTLEAAPAAESPLAHNYCLNGRRSHNIIVHIRKATRGAVGMVNCHPFVRRLWGRTWAFAHNGNLELEQLPPTRHFHAKGDTDSERAFCLILDDLLERFGDQAPDYPTLRDSLQQATARIAALGSFNYLLSDGRALFAHCSTELFQLCREAPFRTASLVDCPLCIDLARHNCADDRLTLVATRPLTADENWEPLPQGRVMLFLDGRAAEGPGDAAPQGEACIVTPSAA